MRSPSSPEVSNETVVETYDRLAVLYDRVIAPLEAGTRRRAVESLDLEASETVLELGCGPGHALVPLARRVSPGGSVIGIDAAKRMIGRARRRVEHSEQTGRINLLLGDARSLPVRDNSVDAVFIEDTLELFSPEEIATVVAECARVLETDGRLGVVTMEREGAEDTRFVRVYEWVFDHFPGYDRIGCRPMYARQALTEGGFKVERQERDRRGYVWPVDILIVRPR